MKSELIELNQPELDYIYSLIEKDIFPCASNLPKSPNEVAMIKALRDKIVKAFGSLEIAWNKIETEKL